MAKHIDSINLTNQFLIAMPGMDDAAFSGTVVYLCDHSERGFVLHESTNAQYTYLMSVPGGLSMTTSKEVLEAVARGKGPEKFLLTLGHAAWEAGQLEEEISHNGWLNVEADPKIIFDVPPEQRFTAALSLLGITPLMLSREAGHA